MDCSWKQNWDETKRAFIRWWNREGLVLGMWGAPLSAVPHEHLPFPGNPQGVDEGYTDAYGRALRNHYDLSRQSFPADILPLSEANMGPGSLALYLGCEPKFRSDTVWFHPALAVEEPDKTGPLTFDPENRWWQLQEKTLNFCAERARGKYMVGCPDLVENIDTLASLRGTFNLLKDMSRRPEWVTEKLEEINLAYFEIYDRVYDIVKLGDGSSSYEAYRIWGPGKTAKVQCDTSVMFSPRMFRRFVFPFLDAQCRWLDYSMYHLDGREEFVHLDAILEIESLDAIEWTPNHGEPFGGDPKWHELYRKILAAGKSVQAYFVNPEEIKSLLDAVGGRGVYILGLFKNEKEIEQALRDVEQFR